VKLSSPQVVTPVEALELPLREDRTDRQERTRQKSQHLYSALAPRKLVVSLGAITEPESPALTDARLAVVASRLPPASRLPLRQRHGAERH